jgi:Rieske Fe-S protein
MESTVSRRGLIRGAVVTVGAGIVGFAVANNSSYAKAKRVTAAANSSGYGGSTKRKRLTTLAAVPVGGGVILSKQDVVVTRDDSGTVHAFSATCTHQGCQVGSVKGGQILCPCHGSKFDAKNGQVIAGPASRPLPAVEVTVEGDDVFVG